MKKLMKRQNCNSLKEKKFIKSNSNNISILFYPTALCKLGPQKQFSKKMEDERFLIKQKW